MFAYVFVYYSQGLLCQDVVLKNVLVLLGELEKITMTERVFLPTGPSFMGNRDSQHHITCLQGCSEREFCDLNVLTY